MWPTPCFMTKMTPLQLSSHNTICLALIQVKSALTLSDHNNFMAHNGNYALLNSQFAQSLYDK